MPLSSYKAKKLRFAFIVFWLLLLYILAALAWWFIELNTQNNQVSDIEMQRLQQTNSSSVQKLLEIKDRQKRKTAQYAGEGSVFLLVIMAGAIFIFRAVRRQLRVGQQQQHFMMAITHELKTPIAVTKLNLETLLKRKLDEQQAQKLLQMSIQETNRLNALCNNMLLVSQMEDRRYNITEEDIPLSELVQECVNEFASRFPQHHYKTGIAGNISIKGDKLLLQLAVNNLIDNATKYTAKGSEITVTLKEAAGKVQFSVLDQGKGIDDSDKKKIFEKFYRVGNKATREAKGTGLGLYLTRKIAQQHKATISVTDNLPTGSIFTIEF